MNKFNEIEFAYQVRQALNNSAQHLTLRQQQRLVQARHIALSRQRQAFFSPLVATTAGAHTSTPQNTTGLWVTVITSLLVLAAGILTLQTLEKNHRLDELADIDTAVLTDELPVSAYLDRGFKVFAQSESHE